MEKNSTAVLLPEFDQVNFRWQLLVRYKPRESITDGQLGLTEYLVESFRDLLVVERDDPSDPGLDGRFSDERIASFSLSFESIGTERNLSEFSKLIQVAIEQSPCIELLDWGLIKGLNVNFDGLVTHSLPAENAQIVVKGAEWFR